MEREFTRWKILDFRGNKNPSLTRLVNYGFFINGSKDYPLETAIDRSDQIYAIAKYPLGDSFGYVKYYKESDAGHEMIVLDSDISIKEFLLSSNNGDEFDNMEILHRFGFNHINPEGVNSQWKGKCSVWIMEVSISYFLRNENGRIIFQNQEEASSWISENNSNCNHPAHRVDFLICKEI